MTQSSTSIRKAKISSRLILINLSSRDRKLLKKLIMKKLRITSKNENVKIIMHDDEEIIIENTIKYLYFWARFAVIEDIEKFIVKESFMKSTKSTFNSAIIKIFAEIVKNSALNKKWKEKNRTYKRVIETKCYFLMLDKNSVEAVNFITMKKVEVHQLEYHFINQFDSRIEENKIWFIEKLIIKS